jgi:hypothetical protein
MRYNNDFTVRCDREKIALSSLRIALFPRELPFKVALSFAISASSVVDYELKPFLSDNSFDAVFFAMLVTEAGGSRIGIAQRGSIAHASFKRLNTDRA